MDIVETDYLVVGAGASGMAFVDELVARADVDVVMVDRRHAPGGHWLDAYPFVTLHQPSAFYGVASRRLGEDRRETTGPNAGFYERATAPEIVSYFAQVLRETLEPTGRVRFYGATDYVGDFGDAHALVSRLSGRRTEVRVRRRVVDARYLEVSVPATHALPFPVADGAAVIAVGDLVRVAAASRFTILGAGKTAMDAVGWLLDEGVDPGRVRWVRPRDSWVLDRAYFQPHERLDELIEGQARQFEAAAGARSVADLFARLEELGPMMRLDRAVEPSMYHCATLSRAEIDQLRTVEEVVRLGHVRGVEPGRVALERGDLATGAGEVLVDCTAGGLTLSPARTPFEPRRITLQQIRTCQPCFNASVVGFLESLDADDAQRNALAAPNPYPNTAADYVRATLTSAAAELAWSGDPQVGPWLEGCRLNAARGMMTRIGEPSVGAAATHYVSAVGDGVAGLGRLQESLAAAR